MFNLWRLGINWSLWGQRQRQSMLRQAEDRRTQVRRMTRHEDLRR